ncbi:hypothetical protein AZC_3672 [Azorhizobium caulinodans ORS 571]|uniref:Ribonuclease VapC n=1 Tax=Azorhizobium caulinodans (strain ATCC 43989 / DSM 5975 / JCM 20966 / LMG 6465 / NBRC 14845 / NCIMB 13405 / ORS 571) TaxID=438753 RepID=A8IMX0_AZOC5|nr:type II toxin-antitoxin system VapC family toxin [Azorhizobium caulinodans]BAF89670.1 hypothetical protein AZC_3672 [Azorhizobium caulinodans ORS 571]
MPFVVDASVSATWLLPDEGNLVASAAYERLLTDHAIVPSLWWFEMCNIFLTNVRRGRVTREQADRALALLADLPIAIDPAPDHERLMRLARAHGLTAYDAAYLALAVRDGVPLVTMDQALHQAAVAEGCAFRS